jgi:hypothetical protein
MPRTQRDGVTMNNDDFRSLAGRHALDALKALAALAVDPAAAARDREHARRWDIRGSPLARLAGHPRGWAPAAPHR